MSEGPPKIALVVEAPADEATAKRLVDRALLEVDWIEPESLEHLRGWAALDAQTPVLIWKRVRQLCDAHNIRVQGQFDGQPGAPDARAARRALMLLGHLTTPDAVVLMRDADDQPERLTGLHQARSDRRHGLAPERIAVGVAIPEREAWHLCGFEPESDAERERVTTERQRLGFDPTHKPEQLHGDGKRSAKRALTALCDDDLDRERRCLDATLDQLRARGRDCGLTDFLAELDARVVPVVAGPKAR